MNTEQIINELEGLVQFLTCPSYIKNALALIKELHAHNENLKKENKYLRERLAEEAEIKEDMSVEFTCVFGQPHKVSDCPITEEIDKAKADTVKKMRHELITRVGSYKDKGDIPSFGLFYLIITETTEELLKAQREENESEKGQPHE